MFYDSRDIYTIIGRITLEHGDEVINIDSKNEKPSVNNIKNGEYDSKSVSEGNKNYERRNHIGILRGQSR